MATLLAHFQQKSTENNALCNARTDPRQHHTHNETAMAKTNKYANKSKNGGAWGGPSSPKKTMNGSTSSAPRATAAAKGKVGDGEVHVKVPLAAAAAAAAKAPAATAVAPVETAPAPVEQRPPPSLSTTQAVAEHWQETVESQIAADSSYATADSDDDAAEPVAAEPVPVQYSNSSTLSELTSPAKVVELPPTPQQPAAVSAAPPPAPAPLAVSVPAPSALVAAGGVADVAGTLSGLMDWLLRTYTYPVRLIEIYMYVQQLPTMS